MSDISTDEFDRRFDDGESMEGYLDTAHAVVRHGKSSNVVVTLPGWLMTFLDEEAARRGVARKAIINTALVEWADNQRERARRIGA